MGILSKLAIYPIKGFPELEIQKVTLNIDEILPNDRRFAFLRPSFAEDSGNQLQWLSKGKLIQVLNTAKLSGSDGVFEQNEAGHISLTWQGVRFDLEQDGGATDFESRFSAWYGEPVRLMDGRAEVAFADQKTPLVSLLNMASVNDMAEKASRPMSWQRLRGNLMMEGLPAWVENDWVGKTLKIGTVQFQVVEPVGRCAAPGTNLNGVRDHDLLAFMKDTFGHTNCGLFLRITKPGIVRLGDTLQIV